MEGQTLSHYKVLEKLGGGGMGVVYKALDTHLDRHVALKLLPPELTRDDEARERFVLEAKAASALDHPNICTIHDIDETPDGQMFIAMGYYDGETLKERIAKGPLPIDESLDIAIQMAQGLSKAHAAGIIHRDIKPANVIITTDGLVKIVDFGIAKLLGVTGPTQTGTTLGTVSYMSPEQIAGEDADQQSDVWSLGAVLYEMLTGRQAFKGENQWAVMNAIINRSPEPPSALRREISAEVEAIVLRALEKPKEQRCGSVQDFLTAVKAQQTARAGPVAMTTSAVGAWQMLRRPSVAVPALLVMIGLGGFGIRYASSGADARWAREEALAEIQRLLAEDAYAPAVALAEEAEQHIPDDPVLAELWTEISAIGSIHVDPAQTDVYVRPYGASDDEWQYLGQTPLENVRLPIGDFQWRLEKKGYEPRVLASKNPSRFFENLFGTPPPLGIKLVPERDVRDGMVHVPGGEFPLSLTGGGLARLLERVALDPFYIGRHEVTNRAFQEFVDQGGYEHAEYWQQLPSGARFPDLRGLL